MQDRGKELDPARHRFHLDGSSRDIAGIAGRIDYPPGPQPPKQGTNPYTPPQASPPPPQYGSPANPPQAAQGIPRFPPPAAAGAGAGPPLAGAQGTPGYSPAQGYPTPGTPSQPMDGAIPYADWSTRFVAYLLDCLIVWAAAVVCFFILGFILFGIPARLGVYDGGLSWFILAYLVIGGVIVGGALWYFPYHWSQTGQTICQKMMHVRVVREDGSLPSLGRSILLRYIVGMCILDSIVFGLPIGWLWPLWDAKKQAWHDKIAGTIVIKVE